jgi:hypothetical protein
MTDLKLDIETENAGAFKEVGGAELHRLVELMGGETGSYLIVHRSGDPDEVYAQAAVAPRAARAPARYVVEHREPAGRHLQAFTDDLSVVQELLDGWAGQRPGWDESVGWKSLSLG